MKVLVSQSFRHQSGRVAARTDIRVFYRDTDIEADVFDHDGVTPLVRPPKTDDLGNIHFYAEEGSYDFEAFGYRVPFDVVAPVAATPTGPGAPLTLEGHIASPTPHPAYDTDMQSLMGLFENGLI